MIAPDADGKAFDESHGGGRRDLDDRRPEHEPEDEGGWGEGNFDE